MRLDAVDGPELNQYGGARAAEALENLTLRRWVRLLETGRDSYGRIVARVTVDGQDVTAAQVRDVHAWHHRRYSEDFELSALERQAGDEGAGLWAEPDPIPPWQWRRGRH